MTIKETFGQAIAMISIEYSGGSLYGLIVTTDS